MTPEMKERWLTALKSGEYPKTKGKLKDGKGFCCLGVLACEAEVEIANGGLRMEKYEDHMMVSGYTTKLSDGVMALTGLDNRQARDLMSINDHTDTFQRVIAYIEENL